MSAAVIQILAQFKWLLPLMVGTVPLVIASIAVGRGVGGWRPLVVAALGTVLVGGTIFATFKVQWGEFRMETSLRDTAEATAEMAVKLEQAVQVNALAIAQLAAQVKEMAALNARTVQPSGGGGSPAFDWNAILKRSTELSATSKATQDAIGVLSDQSSKLRKSLDGLKAAHQPGPSSPSM